MSGFSFDIETTRAILIGMSDYQFLQPVLPAKNNVDDLEKLLLDPNIIGLLSNRILKRTNLRNDELHELLIDFLEADENIDAETLLLYYVGHGIRASNSKELYLTGINSKPASLKTSALHYNEIKELIENSQIQNKVIILDACHSGLVTLGESYTTKEITIKGSYIITSAAWNEKAYFTKTSQNTDFTGAMLNILREGIPLKQQYISLENLFKQLQTQLKSAAPQRKSNLSISDYYFSKNTQYDPNAITTAAANKEHQQTFLSKFKILVIGITIALIITSAWLFYSIERKTDAVDSSATPMAYSNIQFELNSSVLTTESYKILDATSADLIETGKRVEIDSYTSDYEGEDYPTPESRMRLSINNAKAIKNYLIKNKVNEANLVFKAFGETNPIADNSTEEGRAVNRRISFKQISPAKDN